jgi:hypothetical protein
MAIWNIRRYGKLITKYKKIEQRDYVADIKYFKIFILLHIATAEQTTKK